LDQVEAIDTAELAFHDDVDEQNKFIHLLREALRHQTRQDLNWSKGKGILYFRALAADTVRNYAYEASKKKADTDVVNVTMSDKDE
ncbi:hypothetical protein, partial [Salmonella enterica]